MKRYPKFLQVKVDHLTILRLKRIAKRNRRNMSDTVRLMIECEDRVPRELPECEPLHFPDSAKQ